ncbi:MCE family protein [Mycolicibacter sp. MYC123]|uniref:MCE family protein n=1 Tax=[Mycobacterium] zoologicum TaxID=2872311 RepID=A0ABU5YM37_9MYCO|nr:MULTISPECIES: MCE family protein [unclassified Mycolicibacter]MEB3051109.1 MCE family protein [Mycolicibacter sp. MYC123]MEB3064238.1 MCE family protein [Mycolicibacter sp. MYC101]
MRTLEPPNRARIGIIGVVSVLLVTLVGQTFTTVPVLFAEPSYFGQLADTGGLNAGDKVRISGVDVGKVQDLSIEGDHVLVKFSVGANPIGSDSQIGVKTDTILGRKVLAIEPKGEKRIAPRGVLPLGQSTTPYQLYDAVFDVTKAASGWDIDTVKKSLKVLSETVDQTAPDLSGALDGVAKFSDTIGKRDEEITHLLAQANQVASVLGSRSGQVDAVLRNTQTLLAAFNQRSQAISALLGNIAYFGEQVQGLVRDNPSLDLRHVFVEADNITSMLVRRKEDLMEMFTILGRYMTIVNEAIASGPYFKVSTLNLIPFWILQPWVDAAFKKRGITPEEFWRNAGLPEFRYPDPNGNRFANGAPPPAPQVLEGTPEHPGPAVAPGSPCSYAPAAGLFPTPGNPLPCANLDPNSGPFGPNGPYPGPMDVLTSPPNPNAEPAAPGIPIAGRPGEAPPTLPGNPVPLPEANPGARSEPVGPVAGPAPANPGAAPPPGPRAPGPAAPPGPGDQLPAPFITPGEGGNSQPGGGGGARGSERP